MKKILLSNLLVFVSTFILSISMYFTPSIEINIENENIKLVDIVFKSDLENVLYNDDYLLMAEKIDEGYILGVGSKVLEEDFIKEERENVTVVFSRQNNIPNTFRVIYLDNENNVFLSNEITNEAYNKKVYCSSNLENIEYNNIHQTISILIIVVLVIYLALLYLLINIFRLSFLGDKKYIVLYIITNIVLSLLLCNALFLDGAEYAFKTLLIISAIIYFLDILSTFIIKSAKNLRYRLGEVSIINIIKLFISCIFLIICMVV